MRALGLPAYVPPWYPLFRIPVNMTRSVVALTLPGGMDRAAARGQREQQALLHTMIGDDEASIGDSAVHVSQVAWQQPHTDIRIGYIRANHPTSSRLHSKPLESPGRAQPTGPQLRSIQRRYVA